MNALRNSSDGPDFFFVGFILSLVALAGGLMIVGSNYVTSKALSGNYGYEVIGASMMGLIVLIVSRNGMVAYLLTALAIVGIVLLQVIL